MCVWLATVAVSVGKPFTLTEPQVNSLFAHASSVCPTLEACPLQQGDVLVRRLITRKTWPMTLFLDAYFTHSALYAGQDTIVEAGGNDPKRESEIQSLTFSSSDWVNQERSEQWVVLRPLLTAKQRDEAVADAEKIANDPEYRFGIHFLFSGNKKVASCADLVYTVLTNHGLVKDPNTPEVITPDYLVWFAVNHPDRLEVVAVSRGILDK